MANSTPVRRPDTPRLAFPALILANVVLAFGPTLVRLADVGPVAAGFWRLAIALPFLLLLSRRSLMAARLSIWQWTAMIVAGLFFAADLGTWHAGIHLTKVANSTLFGNVSALVLPIWAVFVLGQRLRRLQMLALALAAAGAAILMAGSYELAPRYLRGDLLCLLAGLFYAAYLLLVQDARQRLDGWSVLTVASLAGVLPLLLTALAMGERVLPGDWTPVIALALSSQLIGQGLMTYAIGWFSPLVLGLSLLLQPAVAALLGWMLFGETMSVTDGVGAIAVGAALVLVRLPARP
ncbi:DMT family transporter [Sphingobium sp. AN558]|uniref:DMT family transporter n=1 Tax=Sphingobium sp. AN558 TaxID=3133442 RepID=UPI0030C257D1